MPIADDLAKLAALRKSGDLTDEQYHQASSAVLAEYATPSLDDTFAPPPPQSQKKLGKPRFLGLGLRGWLIVGFVIIVGTTMSNYKSTAERREQLRVSDPVAYEAMVAKEQADAITKAETDRVAAEDRSLREAAAAQVEQEQRAVAAAAEAEKKQSGFHCLSPWDGSHGDLIEWTKDNLNDPNSFEHDETRIAPVTESGEHTLIMTYRAKNGFGGVVRGSIVATIRNSDCRLVDIVSSS